MDATFILPTEPQDRGLSGRARVLLGLTWFFMAFAIQSVSLRLYLTRKFSQSLALDDWIMLLALGCHIVFEIFLTLASVSGLGYPMETMTIQEIVDMSKWAWCTVPGNILANVTSRISIAILLVQIFGVRKWFRWLIIIYTTALTVLGLANFTFVFLQASPFVASWDFRMEADWRLPHLPHNILIFIQLILFSISDFIYAFFPVLFIWRLNMATRKKVGLMFVMAGSFITMAAAIGRAVIVSDTFNVNTEISAQDAMDSDHVFVTFGVGSLLASVEVSLVIILGSLPKLKVATKLGLFKTLSSSFNSMMSKLRPGTQLSNSRSRSNKGWADSDVELNHSGKRGFPRHPGGQHDSSVQAGATNPVADFVSRDQVNGIRVTEGYAVTYRPESCEPKICV
ncbi:hypothetical protein DL771_000105 [Monosporascus sp. 5C6A]|nr:hypothetical protein DL771_000105 [Monosporascus sp. 5C6A]